MRKDTSYTIDVLDTLSTADFPNKIKITEKFVAIQKLTRGHEIILQRKIRISPQFAWAVGFYFAEGSHLEGSIGVSNCYFPLVLKFKDCLEKIFPLYELSWTAFLRTKRIDKKKVGLLKKEMGINRIRTYVTPLASNDNIEIRAHSAALTKVFHKLIGMSLKFIVKDRRLSLSFIKAYEAGDGSVITRNGEQLHSIVITVKDSTMKDFIKRVFYSLYKVGLNERKTKGVYDLGLCNVHHMSDLIIDGHFEDYPKQRIKFLEGYKKKEYVRSHIRYWLILKRPRLIKSLARLSHRSHWSVRDAMHEDEKLGLVKSFAKKSRYGWPYKVFLLTKKGRTLTRMLSEIYES